jgi:hypothetical protein
MPLKVLIACDYRDIVGFLNERHALWLFLFSFGGKWPTTLEGNYCKGQE